MPLKRVLAVALAALVTSLPVTSSEAVEGGWYLPGAAGLIVIWCSAAPHAIVPVGDPQDYASPTSWLFSGEPECAVADAMNLALEATGEERSDIGYGGFGWLTQPAYFFQYATARTDDLATGEATFMTLVSFSDHYGDQVSEGCGPQTVLVVPPHDPWGQGYLQMMLWAFLPAAGVDDDLALCFTSAGHIEATFGL